jgi:septum site-determining protein MinC
MAAVKHPVTIKGVKDGLLFLLDDSCPFEDVISDLTHKLEKTHHNILTGPLVHVFVKLGKRQTGDEEKEQIRGIIGARGNLLIQSIESDSDKPEEAQEEPIQLIKNIVRSGQVLHIEGNLLLIGDVNPGGIVTATGDIYIMGSLRGMAHAGCEGNEKAIISASHMKPTQLRIAQVISRPPDEWGIGDTYMEFAYINNGVMEIDKVQHMSRVRP